jgi:hypothetical protein
MESLAYRASTSGVSGRINRDGHQANVRSDAKSV